MTRVERPTATMAFFLPRRRDRFRRGHAVGRRHALCEPHQPGDRCGGQRGGGPWGGTDRFGNAKISRIDAAGAGSLWTTGANVVQRLDPANGHVTAAIPVPHAWRVIFWHGLAWALTGGAPSGLGTVVGIDPASNRVVLHGVPFRGAPMAIAAGPTGLWVVFANANHTSQELVHLALASGPN